MIVHIYDRIGSDWPAKSSQSLLPSVANAYGYGDVHFSDRGKPTLSEGYCSVSHSRHRLIIAFSSYPIGIDLEYRRELKPELIKRLHLNPKTALEDWCCREAWIKLDDDPSHLVHQLPISLVKNSLNLGDDWVCKIVSRQSIDDIVIEHHSE